MHFRTPIILLILLIVGYFNFKLITDMKKNIVIMDDNLKKSEILFKSLFDQAPLGISIGHNDKFNIAHGNSFKNINPMFEKITGRTYEELKTTNWPEITHADDVGEDMELFNKFKSGEIDGYEIEKRYIKPDNTVIWIHKKIYPLNIKGLEEYNHICTIENISERKNVEAQIQHMLEHDYLTNLYNRQYFEKYILETDNLYCPPISILTADINGMRFINDAFGYLEGDNFINTVSKILKSSLRPDDLLARTGGDEFVALLLHTDNEEALKIKEKIKDTCIDYNKNNKAKLAEISLSIGCATKDEISIPLPNIMKAAYDDLKNNQLLNRKSYHSHIITSMLATVYEKSQETEEHVRRLGDLSTKFGKILNLSNQELSELKLLAMLHDIGKVGIDEKVLKKPSGLTTSEWKIMKKHPEIGYRLAKSSFDIEHIAEYILYHHEHWDGSGYPKGLKGVEIPLLSRIIAVIDAYDAMTVDRIYRKALTNNEAIDEIRKNAGTQFDPDLAKSFIDNMESLQKAN